jgi:hypothetical protein
VAVAVSLRSKGPRAGGARCRHAELLEKGIGASRTRLRLVPDDLLKLTFRSMPSCGPADEPEGLTAGDPRVAARLDLCSRVREGRAISLRILAWGSPGTRERACPRRSASCRSTMAYRRSRSSPAGASRKGNAATFSTGGRHPDARAARRPVYAGKSGVRGDELPEPGRAYGLPSSRSRIQACDASSPSKRTARALDPPPRTAHAYSFARAAPCSSGVGKRMVRSAPGPQSRSFG